MRGWRSLLSHKASLQPPSLPYLATRPQRGPCSGQTGGPEPAGHPMRIPTSRPLLSPRPCLDCPCPTPARIPFLRKLLAPDSYKSVLIVFLTDTCIVVMITVINNSTNDMDCVYCAPVTGQVLRTPEMNEAGWAWTLDHFSFPASL